VETGPLPLIGYPDTGGRCYVMNKQLSRLTPFSQQVAPDFAWRSYDAEGRKVGTHPAIMFVTANLNVNYIRPTPMNRELMLKAHIVENKGRKIVVSCMLVADDMECANARVTGVRVT
jgi:acyl-coenzyme A thioesterase PaaI-like protein